LSPPPGDPFWLSATPIFVVSLCDGIGSIFVVLKLLRKRFRGIAAEMDPHARALASHHHPKVQAYADALDITSELIMTEFRKRPYSGLHLTAGPPCSLRWLLMEAFLWTTHNLLLPIRVY